MYVVCKHVCAGVHKLLVTLRYFIIIFILKKIYSTPVPVVPVYNIYFLNYIFIYIICSSVPLFYYKL